ncbi:MAG: glucose 1-dehydrogenase [Parvibaculales bacterium]
MSKLNNKVAVISGGARGIGGATSELFVENGAKVLITDVLEENGKALAEKLGDAAVFTKLDVRDENAWKDVMTLAEETFGGVDILVNCAGVLDFCSLADAEVETMRRTIDINLMGVVIGTQAAIEPMRKRGGGAIVNISSSDGLIASNAHAAYVASKWGVTGFTKAAALELGLENIRVNSVHPGGVYTELANMRGVSREEFEHNFNSVTAQRACDPIDIARGVLYLASEDAQYCMGTQLAIDGGLTAGLYYYGSPGAPRLMLTPIPE